MGFVAWLFEKPYGISSLPRDFSEMQRNNSQFPDDFHRLHDDYRVSRDFIKCGTTLADSGITWRIAERL
jgi:hypothetical protein